MAARKSPDPVRELAILLLEVAKTRKPERHENVEAPMYNEKRESQEMKVEEEANEKIVFEGEKPSLVGKKPYKEQGIWDFDFYDDFDDDLL